MPGKRTEKTKKESKYMTVCEFAYETGVCGKTIRKWIKEGFLMSLKTKGGHRRIPKIELEKIINGEHDNVA